MEGGCTEKDLREFRVYAWSIYIVYLLLFIVIPILSIILQFDIPRAVSVGAQIGSVVASYTALGRIRKKCPDNYLVSHFIWQIKTFWFSVIYGIVLAIIIVLLGIFIGFDSDKLNLILIVLLLPIYIWLLYRTFKGILYLQRDKVIANKLF